MRYRADDNDAGLDKIAVWEGEGGALDPEEAHAAEERRHRLSLLRQWELRLVGDPKSLELLLKYSERWLTKSQFARARGIHRGNGGRQINAVLASLRETVEQTPSIVLDLPSPWREWVTAWLADGRRRAT